MPSHTTRRADLERACLHCGTVFWPYHDRSQLCSRACVHAAMRRPIDRHCEACGSAFQVRASAADQGKGRFCSKPCADAAKTDERPLDVRFWERVDRSSECWVWTRYRDRDGYGVFDPSRENGERRAHRWSWILFRGTIPNGLDVLHRCDNPPCVRPDHLFVGTTQANVADKVAKGRHAHGERVGGAKMTPEAVREMRRLRDGGMLLDALSALFGVHVTTVSHICRRETWRHVS